VLVQLEVKNIALIDELTLEFDPGFNVMTGETGAGKSIIIDALGLALGGRFSSEMIRTGADSAVISAVFDTGNQPELEIYLEESGVPVDPEHMLIIQREISAGGKNRCRVNGHLVTVLTLNQIGDFLLDIHGQHEHQSLLFPEKQLELLDEYCGRDCLELRSHFSETYHQWRSLENEYRNLRQNESDLARRIDILQFQRDEILGAKLVLGEDEDLLKERELLTSSEKLFSAATHSYSVLYDNNDGKSAVELLGDAERTLSQAAEIDKRLGGILEMLREAACQTEEASREIRGYQEQIEFNPERLTEIEDRLDELNRLKRKYGSSIAEILLFAEKCSKELQDITNAEERSLKLESELTKIRICLGEMAGELTRLRRIGADRLQTEIVAQLADLNMARTQFEIQLTQAEIAEGIPYGDRQVEAGPAGTDRIEFLVAPNPGEALKPMTKIASGGELSRMMLALKAILAELDQIPTMVFDEIDVGIGGRTAQAVAEKILFIGQARQVLCITHLPQIASMAKRHFYIEKTVVGERTKMTVRSLMMNERIDELARMLGGAEVTETTRQHAREMLTMAESLRLRLVGQMS
jgi:DNA repair protein RecN (Recombination protein N)